MSEIKISEGDVLLSSSDTTKKIGRIENRVLTKHETFTGLFKKFCAFTVFEGLIDKADIFVYEVIEENGTSTPYKYTFTITQDEIRNNSFRHIEDEGLKKIVLPLSLFQYKVDNEQIQTMIEKFGIEWFIKLKYEIYSPYMRELSKFIQTERKTAVIYPKPEDVFKALKLTPYSDINVVILGQDPYHNGLASGLAFSTNDELITPKSLDNIFTEVEKDIYDGFMLDRNPILERWAKQGVLLLNTILTVRKGEPLSHANKGWETFTNKILMSLYEINRPIVWILWGKNAEQAFDKVIEEYGRTNPAHLILRAAHPSPFSAAKGFFGCKHFSKCNNFLKLKNLKEIVW